MATGLRSRGARDMPWDTRSAFAAQAVRIPCPHRCPLRGAAASAPRSLPSRRTSHSQPVTVSTYSTLKVVESPSGPTRPRTAGLVLSVGAAQGRARLWTQLRPAAPRGSASFPPLTASFPCCFCLEINFPINLPLKTLHVVSIKKCAALPVFPGRNGILVSLQLCQLE